VIPLQAWCGPEGG